MRLTKFRAKNKLNGIWWYGSTEADRIDYSTNTLPMITFWRWIGEGALDIETLGQFTGQIDINSVEVYEADIVRVTYDLHEEPFVGQVAFYRTGQFLSMDDPTNPYPKTKAIFMDFDNIVRVIGNIHSKEEKDV